MEREWYQFSLRTLFAFMTIVAVACGTYKLFGPPFTPTYQEAIYGPNLIWWTMTIWELYVVCLCVGYRRSRRIWFRDPRDESPPDN